MMKILAIMIPVCLIAGILHAQTIIDKQFSFSQKQTVTLNIQFADSIRIIPWNKDEIDMHASVNINDNKDNDLYHWTFDDSGTGLSIKAKLSEKDAKERFRNCDCCCNDMQIYCEVHVPARAAISVETINGNIILSGMGNDIHVKTISGFIDLTAPSDLKADMEFKTISGMVFTDFALHPSNQHHSGPTDFITSLNGGGNTVNLQTISGNIYFRKSD